MGFLTVLSREDFFFFIATLVQGLELDEDDEAFDLRVLPCLHCAVVGTGVSLSGAVVDIGMRFDDVSDDLE